MPTIYTLLTDQTTDTAGAAPIFDVEGGGYMVFVDGVLDGASVHIEAERAESSGFFDVQGSPLTTLERPILTLPECRVRAEITGSGASTSVSVVLVQGAQT